MIFTYADIKIHAAFIDKIYEHFPFSNQRCHWTLDYKNEPTYHPCDKESALRSYTLIPGWENANNDKNGFQKCPYCGATIYRYQKE